MALALPRCEELIKKECLDREDVLGCKNAMSFCGKHISTPFFNAQLNPYDISQSCTPEQMADSLCYPQTKVIRKYLDQPHVRALLGVNPDLGPFESCSPAVGQAFHLANDGLGKTWYYVAALLEHGASPASLAPPSLNRRRLKTHSIATPILRRHRRPALHRQGSPCAA